MSATNAVSRRSRSMEAKQRRISEAAAELFDAKGFSAVTTQQISDRADVAAGTLFRYAASKSELLLMVYNSKLDEALREGLERAESVSDPVEAVVALVEPLVTRASESPENAATYQRELLFGSPSERFRLEGLAHVQAFEEALAARLVDSDRGRGVTDDHDAARVASSSVFAVVHLAIARLYTGAHRGHDLRDDLRHQIAQIVRGLAATREATGERRP